MSSPTVLAALVKNVLEAVGSLGADVPALIAAAGLDPAVLDDPDARVPVEADLRLWRLLSPRGDGVAIGAHMGVAGLGIVGYAMAHGTTVGDALAWLARFDAVVHPGLVPRVERRREDGRDRVVFVRWPVPAFAELRQPLFAQVAAIVALLGAVSGRDLRPVAVVMPLARAADSAALERHVACTVRWGGACLEVAFEGSVLDVPLPRAEPRLFGYLARRAEVLLAELPAEASWAVRVQREIGGLLATGRPRLEVVARRLAVSGRTLHRRLSAEGVRFVDLVDAARRERALVLLGDPALGVAEIAFLLGYSEPAAFFRAFRRWTGRSPRTFRRERIAR